MANLLPKHLKSAALIIAISLLSGQVSAYAVIDLSPPAGGIDANSSIDADVDAGADANISSEGELRLDASNLTGSETLRIDRAEVQVESESNVNGRVFVESQAVQTVGDLRAYASSTIRSDVMVDSLNFTSDTVEIRYKQKGGFLVLVPITFTVTARATADGEVETPFFTASEQAEVAAQMHAVLRANLESENGGQVGG